MLQHQLSTVYNRTQQLSDTNTTLQQQLATVYNQTQQLSNSITMSQQQLTLLQQLTTLYNQTHVILQLTTLHNQTQQLSDSDTMLQQQLAILYNQTQGYNTMLQQQLTTLHSQVQQLGDSDTMLQNQVAALHNQTQDFNTKLQQQLTTLHNQTQQQQNDVLQQQQNDTELMIGQFPFYPATSCAALPPSSPSDYYWVRASDGSAVSVYCDMTRSCGGVTGGWMRVAELDMTNSSHQCPCSLMERNDSPNIRTCVRNEFLGGCSSVELSTANIQYSTVCGRIKAYQVGRPNQFRLRISTDIDSHYVDGVSLTYGSPRQHIWTLAAARDENQTCVCSGTNGTFPPEFVGQDYFCEAGSELNQNPLRTLASEDPLWDGDGCNRAGNTCCSFNNPPWFYKQLPQPTTDDIEMRVCRHTYIIRGNDVAIEIVEMYVK